MFITFFFSTSFFSDNALASIILYDHALIHSSAFKPFKHEKKTQFGNVLWSGSL